MKSLRVLAGLALPIVLVCGCKSGDDPDSVAYLLDHSVHKRVETVDSKAMVAFKVSEGDPAVYQQLVEQLHSKDNSIRELAAHFVGQTGRPEGAAELLKMLSDPTPAVQASAVAGLGRIQDPKTLPDIIKFAEASRTKKDASPDCRVAAIQALTNFQDPSALAEVRNHLQDSDGKSRFAAWDAIARLKDRTELESAKQTFATSSDQSTKIGAAEALMILDPKNAPRDQIHAFIEPFLGKDGNSMDRDVRGAVVTMAGLIGDPKDTTPVARIMRRHGVMSYRSFPALTQLGGPAAQKALEDRMEDKAPEVTWFAAVGNFKPLLPILVSTIKNVEPEASASCVLGVLRMSNNPGEKQKAVETAKEILAQKQWTGRYRLAIGLHLLKDPVATSLLEQLSNDPYDLVQRAAKGQIIDWTLQPLTP